MSAGSALPFKISVLVFMHDAQGRLLLIQRTKAPNKGCWSPIGGKLEMATGESPFECAVREVGEESGATVATHTTKTAGAGGTGSWTAFVGVSLPVTAANAAVVPGGCVTFAFAKASTGTDVPVGVLEIEYLET